MRGKDVTGKEVVDGYGITPAYAGKSSCSFQFLQKRGDHPRLCGEKQNVMQSGLQSAGSPPPMRGKDSPVGQAAGETGITPAYAGKRTSGKTWARVA